MSAGVLRPRSMSFKPPVPKASVRMKRQQSMPLLTRVRPPVVLASNYPQGSFVNYNRTLVPPNTLSLCSGFGLTPQTSLADYKLANFSVEQVGLRSVCETTEVLTSSESRLSPRKSGIPSRHSPRAMVPISCAWMARRSPIPILPRFLATCYQSRRSQAVNTRVSLWDRGKIRLPGIAT